ncbi:hypothetical protein GALL_527570 [mine drainage metagenome]|uniref:Uncharacterized protein n=1 Tax=mine drainage metagenome TaxID=410659 RepID=A0A1J5PDT4_9ZZZZ
MPAISISNPRKMNSGTARRIRWLMPSSMRPTSTISGVRVVSARYPKIASPNAKAIGTPANTQKPTTPTKKMTRLILPSGRSHGAASQKTATSSATDSTACSTSLMSPTLTSRSNANSAIRQTPTGSAAARQVLDICSAGVVIKLSS